MLIFNYIFFLLIFSSFSFFLYLSLFIFLLLFNFPFFLEILGLKLAALKDLDLIKVNNSLNWKWADILLFLSVIFLLKQENAIIILNNSSYYLKTIIKLSFNLFIFKIEWDFLLLRPCSGSRRIILTKDPEFAIFKDIKIYILDFTIFIIIFEGFLISANCFFSCLESNNLLRSSYFILF